VYQAEIFQEPKNGETAARAEPAFLVIPASAGDDILPLLNKSLVQDVQEKWLKKHPKKSFLSMNSK
jgi:hypothetical protein